MLSRRCKSQKKSRLSKNGSSKCRLFAGQSYAPRPVANAYFTKCFLSMWLHWQLRLRSTSPPTPHATVLFVWCFCCIQLAAQEKQKVSLSFPPPLVRVRRSTWNAHLLQRQKHQQKAARVSSAQFLEFCVCVCACMCVFVCVCLSLYTSLLEGNVIFFFFFFFFAPFHPCTYAPVTVQIH